jgi:glycosyltransferase involved in cell wall biosynthesis
MNVVSIVIPLYNEEELVPQLLQRLLDVETGMEKTSFELIVVNDGSHDETQRVLEKSLPSFSCWKLVSLARNFGLQPAYKAGLDQVEGDCVIFMDGDLQDPPEVIPDLVAEWRSGSKVVVACRNSRKETGFRRLCFDAFHIIFHKLTEGFVPKNSGMFGLMDREVANHVKAMPEINLFFPALRCWPGFRQSTVTYDRDARFAGDTKQTFGRLLRYAWDGITSFSELPLQLITMMGAIISLLSFVLALGLVAFRILQLFGFFSELVVLGFTSIVIAVLFMGGLQMIALGVIGNYMSRLYQEAKRRPHYIIGDMKKSTGDR